MALKDWKKTKPYDGRWDYYNRKTGEELQIRFRGKDDNFVSILGNGRYQPEYLCGGNSKIHNATKSQALKFAKAYMRTH